MNNNIKAGAEIHAGDGGYSVGTKEKYDEFVKGRNQSLGKMRIKSLIERAEYQAKKQSGYEDWEVYVTPDSQVVFEKFAELIVKECMKVVINGKYSATECERNTHRIAHNNARDEASSDIKKHFGVKE